MILHEYRINYHLGDTIRLKPCFDWHVGNRFCDIKKLKAYLDDQDDNTYLIGGGDLLDSIITKDIKRYTKSADASEGDAIIDEQVDKVAGLLEPYRGRIIGLGLGNHEGEILKYHGSNPIRRLCKRLDTRSLGFSWLVKLALHENGSRGRTVFIRGHHGFGGGSRTQGGSLTTFSRDAMYYQADIMLFGHVHRRQTDRIERMEWGSGGKLRPKPVFLAICGTFLRTLSDDDIPTYSEEKGYPPVAIGGVNLFLHPDSHGWVKISSDV